MCHEHSCKVSAQSDHKCLSIGAVDQDWTSFPECDFLPLQAMSGHATRVSGHKFQEADFCSVRPCPDIQLTCPDIPYL
jgi:hypothetical protein